MALEKAGEQWIGQTQSPDENGNAERGQSEREHQHLENFELAAGKRRSYDQHDHCRYKAAVLHESAEGDECKRQGDKRAQRPSSLDRLHGAQAGHEDGEPEQHQQGAEDNGEKTGPHPQCIAKRVITRDCQCARADRDEKQACPEISALENRRPHAVRIAYAKLAHCALMPPSLTTRSHFLISFSMKAVNSIGLICTMAAPS